MNHTSIVTGKGAKPQRFFVDGFPGPMRPHGHNLSQTCRKFPTGVEEQGGKRVRDEKFVGGRKNKPGPVARLKTVKIADEGFNSYVLLHANLSLNKMTEDAWWERNLSASICREVGTVRFGGWDGHLVLKAPVPTLCRRHESERDRGGWCPHKVFVNPGDSSRGP